MKHALALVYTGTDSTETTMDYLRCDTPENRAQSLEALQDPKIQNFLSADEQDALAAVFAEGSTATEAVTIILDETNYPLPILLPRDLEALSGAEAAEADFDSTEGPMCDGGASRKETLKHARSAFRTIEGIPGVLENIVERLTALEAANAPAPAPAAPAAESTPPADAVSTEDTVVPPADAPNVENTVADTSVADVTVTSPLLAESTEDNPPAPAGDVTALQEPVTAESIILADKARIQLARLRRANRSSTVSLG